MRKVPLGLAYIAGCLREKGVYVEAYSLNCDPISAIDFNKFHFVGITCLTPLIEEINTISKVIKATNPEIKIVVGGPHPTFNPHKTFEQLPLISYAITGEGEYSFPELITNEQNYKNIAGVYYLDEKNEVRGTPHEKIDISLLPYPDQRIFDHGNLEKRNPYRAIIASRGCPYKCNNCQPILNLIQPVQIRTPDDVLAEIQFRQKKFGECYFGFIDSEFPFKKTWLLEFYNLVKQNDISFAFHCNARSDLLDEEILEIFKNLNINRLAVGIESGVQRVVDDVLEKKIKLDYTHKMFEYGQISLGIRMHGHFMLGIPGETPSTKNEIPMLLPMNSQIPM